MKTYLFIIAVFSLVMSWGVTVQAMDSSDPVAEEVVLNGLPPQC